MLLRAYCLYRQRLLGEIARVAARTVTAAIRTEAFRENTANHSTTRNVFPPLW